ncbi:FAD-dependent oxidoreductase [Pseudonocardia sp. Cha107L01]|uniref:FAD-dependent oxidoreductase n=1 Tax=Pseudonocardia sp. Cha107L01 TaxID=3457576 RepID=UPI00403EAD5B
MSKPRIVILGGGVGGVTTAVELSRGHWRQRFDSITLYQQGWRLGGKGASGRRESDLRIQEHGLHIWFGFYENAFRMLRECHQELDRRAADPTLAQARWKLAKMSVDDSFQACGPITLTDHDGCDWKPWVADFFRFDHDRPWYENDPRLPGQRPEDWSAVFFAARCLFLAADLAASLIGSNSGPSATITPGSGGPPPVAASIGALEALLGDVRGLLSGGLREILGLAGGILDAAARVGAAVLAGSVIVDLVLRAVDFATQQLRNRADEYLRADDTVRRAWYVIDLMLAIARGMVEDDVISANDFGRINDVDFRSWLLGHGAARESVDSALVRTVVYDLAFAYRGGDPQRPAAEAGTALRGLLRTFFTYRGALMWKMNSGMGDIVFAPLYELLEKRGVKVEFFHRVEQVNASPGAAASPGLVERIELDVQATLPTTTKAGNFLNPRPPTPLTPTDPTDPAGASPESTASPEVTAIQSNLALWPATPRVPHTGPQPEPEAAAYESWLMDPAITKVAGKTLVRGADFDDVVFALPIATVPLIAHDLVSHSKAWSEAVEKIETVPTQALQLWLTEPASTLSDHADGSVVGGFAEPYDTWADMGHLKAQERVGAATVAYFCNVLVDTPPPPRGPDANAWLKDQDALVRAQAVRFLRRDIRHLWAHALDPVTGEFDWNRLVAPPGVVGEARLDYQFLRANVEPSERYVLSVPGSSAHRIHPGDTGFGNLYAAGDWTACGLDAGCVEAATMSGLLAANAILAKVGATTEIRYIIGYDGP